MVEVKLETNELPSIERNDDVINLNDLKSNTFTIDAQSIQPIDSMQTLNLKNDELNKSNLSLLSSSNFEFESTLHKTTELPQNPSPPSLFKASKRSIANTTTNRLTLAPKLTDEDTNDMSPTSSNASSPHSNSLSQSQTSIFSPPNTSANAGIIMPTNNPISPTSTPSIQINLNDGQVILCAVCGDRATGLLKNENI